MIKSRCGTICDISICKEIFGVDCAGCLNIEHPHWGACSFKICCESKQLNHCGECENFPCEEQKKYAYDKEHGDNGARIAQCKEWAKLYPR
ncbi:MAG: DUF3795 domain-containing protein [Oscillospiraceae bacterium]|nr:DUF3795 domain-containing protein [Oscillospiraceae bacterium]